MKKYALVIFALFAIGAGTAITLIHDATLVGNGSQANPLKLAPCGSAGQVWRWNGSAWACASAPTSIDFPTGGGMGASGTAVTSGTATVELRRDCTDAQKWISYHFHEGPDTYSWDCDQPVTTATGGDGILVNGDKVAHDDSVVIAVQLDDNGTMQVTDAGVKVKIESDRTLVVDDGGIRVNIDFARGLQKSDAGIQLKDEIDILGLRLNGTYVMSSDITNSNVQLLSGTSVITSGWFGDGSDGTCNYDGSTTVLGVAPSGSVYNLNRMTFCQTETVSTGITVNVTGYPIYVHGTLTVNGSGHFANNGNDGTTPSGACAVSPGGAQVGNGIFTSSPGTAGGNGSTTGGVAGGATTFTCRGLGAAGAGGNGASGSGGAGGSKIDMAATAGDCHDWHHLHDTGRSFSGVTTFWTGIGGGGGGGTNVANGCGGGGGSGAGAVVVYAHRIAGTGTLMFTATGGNGGAGNNNIGCTNGGNGCGGGGGGTGGLMYVITGAFFGTGCTLVTGSPGTSSCISVAGGSGGAKTGSTGNTNGTSGGSGVAVIEVGG